MALNIVLVEPEIPQNTGNIVRTCAATGTDLHLIKPLGFSLDDKYLKRAGLDYWQSVKIKLYDSFTQLVESYKGRQFYYCSTKAPNCYCDVKYSNDCFLVFGKETAGLPRQLLIHNYQQCIRIPMKDNIRSLNLSNSVAIVLYEALRQLKFVGLRQAGALE
ncbi:MAG: tRNA (uridine(34)/cytosine(34)/5-carboxymethylaminomethyluridine(34)-2'-O)-methyltransferase TrmL [Mahellales bacterium]|jgi:tRNA (cytidine/uridine-2'-O-)-methyltransferase